MSEQAITFQPSVLEIDSMRSWRMSGPRPLGLMGLRWGMWAMRDSRDFRDLRNMKEIGWFGRQNLYMC